MSDDTPPIECPTCGAVVGIVYCGACVACGDAATRERIQALRPEGDEDRAQLSSSHGRWVAMLAIGLTVIGIVGREMLATQRAALAQCAPDCQLGAPLFAGVPWDVVAVFVVATLLLAWGGNRWGPRQL